MLALAALILAIASNIYWFRKWRAVNIKVLAETDRAEHWKNLCEEMKTFVAEAKPLQIAAKQGMEEMRKNNAKVQNDIDGLRRRMHAYKVAWESILSSIPTAKQEIAKRNMDKYLATLPVPREAVEEANVVVS